MGLTAVRLGFSWLGGLVILGITDSRCLYCDWFAVGFWLGVFLIIRPVGVVLLGLIIGGLCSVCWRLGDLRFWVLVLSF